MYGGVLTQESVLSNPAKLSISTQDETLTWTKPWKCQLTIFVPEVFLCECVQGSSYSGKIGYKPFDTSHGIVLLHRRSFHWIRLDPLLRNDVTKVLNFLLHFCSFNLR